MHMKYISHAASHPPGLLRKTAAIAVTAAVAGVVLMASAVFFAVILVVGVFAMAYLWWKTRDLRKMMRNFPPRGADTQSGTFRGEEAGGEVIEGEVIRVHESRDDRQG